MSNGFFHVPVAKNEPVKQYGLGSIERKEIIAKLAELRAEVRDIPMYIGGKEIRAGEKISIHPPHDHKHLLGYFYRSTKHQVSDAIDVALASRKQWQNLAWEQRAAIFLKAADLISGPYRAELNAATMLGQSQLIRFLLYSVCSTHK